MFRGTVRIRLPGLDLRPEILCGIGHVEKSLINRYFFDLCGIFSEDLDKLMRVFAVRFRVRRDEDELRTFFEGGYDGLTGGHSVFFCGDGLGCDHAVAGPDITADGRRNETQVDCGRIFPEALDGGPGKEG